MRIGYHPDFADDINRFAAGYSEISAPLAERFRREIDEAIALIKAQPTAAGHFLKLRGIVAPDLRRRNLASFPFFALYGLRDDWLVFGSVIPSRSDPLFWLSRFGPAE